MTCTTQRVTMRFSRIPKLNDSSLLMDYLRVHFDVRQTLADADVLMVMAAILVSQTNLTILVGDDTDILVRCLALASSEATQLILDQIQR